MGITRIFQRGGGVTLCQSEGTHQIVMSIIKKVSTKGLFNYGQDIVMAFLPSVVGCLVKKRLTKGGSRAPQDPPGYAVVNGNKLIATRCPAFCPNTTTSP